MICTQVMGNHVTITVAGSQGHFQLNVFKPVMISNLLRSSRLLADGCRSFADNCLKGLRPRVESIRRNLNSSLMLVTALSPYIGYDKCAEIAQKAHADQSSLKKAAVALGYLTQEQFDRWVRPENMCHPKPRSNM